MVVDTATPDAAGDRCDTPGPADAVAAPAQDLALWATLCAPAAADPAGGAQTAAIAGDAPLGDAVRTAIEQLSMELGPLVGAGIHGGLDACSFDLELPGLGSLQGRLSVRRDRADMELRALTPAVAAALRSRRHELQQGIDQAAGGYDVTLFIA